MSTSRACRGLSGRGESWLALVRTLISVLIFGLPALAGAQSIAPDKASYAPNEPIVLAFKGFPGNAQDWITIVPSDAPADTWGQWFYTGGKQAGTLKFSGLPAGTYQARGYFDWPKGGTTIRVEVGLHVGAAASQATPSVASAMPKLTASSPKYGPDQPIRVRYEGFSGAAHDWITIVPRGTPQDQYAEWYYTDGKGGGELTFKGLPPGEYEARGYFDWPKGGYEIRARMPLLVQGEVKREGVWLRAARPVYLANEPIDVSYGGFPHPGRDWITIVPKSNPSDTYAEWFYTDASDGSVRFEGLPPGSYQVRAYFDWPSGGYAVKASRELEVVSDRKQVKTSGPCANAKLLARMDHWLAKAVPPDAGADKRVRYDAWGRSVELAASGRRAAAPKSKEGRCVALLRAAAKLRSKNNLGTLKEYLDKDPQ